MSDENEGSAREISEVSRRAIMDHFALGGSPWSGRMSDDDFLARLYDLAEMPSYDGRFSNAAQDIYQHTVRNNDWEKDWVFTDARFNLLRAADDVLLRFLCETLHPVVRPDEEQVAELLAVYNDALAPDGWRIVEGRPISGRPTFLSQRQGRAVVFSEPTGWEKVDRQLEEMRLRLETATTEEQCQTVGLLCREVLISVALEVYSSERHPSADGTLVSSTDAKRMLEAIFEAELKGASNEEARAHARAAVRLALALQHKRMAEFRTAALCAEGTWAVVNMLAIIAGRRRRIR